MAVQDCAEGIPTGGLSQQVVAGASQNAETRYRLADRPRRRGGTGSGPAGQPGDAAARGNGDACPGARRGGTGAGGMNRGRPCGRFTTMSRNHSPT